MHIFNQTCSISHDIFLWWYDSLHIAVLMFPPCNVHFKVIKKSGGILVDPQLACPENIQWFGILFKRNLSAPARSRCNLKWVILTLISKIDILSISFKIVPVGCHRTSSAISQHYFRWWRGAIKQQTITWTNGDKVQWRHMARPQWVSGHNVQDFMVFLQDLLRLNIFMLSRRNSLVVIL